MRDLYVWSGSLMGVHVRARGAEDAVVEAVRGNVPCILGDMIRVTLSKLGAHALDVHYRAPYEETFPDLFDGSLDVVTEVVTREG